MVVVTWNGAHLLPSCLEAIQHQSIASSRYLVHVVDNGSTDSTVADLRREFPEVTVQCLEENRGFAGGCAAALEVITTDWVVLVNNDATVSGSFLESLLVAAERPGSERTAAWSARVLLAEPVDGVRRVNSTGLVVYRDGNGADRDWLSPADGPAPAEEVFGFCGAAALLRTSAVRAVGGFDEKYFMYYEDTDLSWRLRLGGWQVRYCHEAVVHHEHGASSHIGSPSFRFYNERNRLVTLVKDAPWSVALPVLARHPLMSVTRLVRRAPHRDIGRVRLRAYAAFLALLPHAVRERHRMPAAMRRRRALVAQLLIRG